jgi:D-inositol-3-phosphate glycosyltransferase
VRSASCTARTTRRTSNQVRPCGAPQPTTRCEHSGEIRAHGDGTATKPSRLIHVRILLVSQMYPGPSDPDLGTFVAQLERALAARGHQIERAVLDSRAGGRRRYALLAGRVVTAARRFDPDVVYAHFLVPAGLAAAVGSRKPLVVTAHGQDVRNIGVVPSVAAATRYVVRRAAAVVAVSDYLRRELEAKVEEARDKTAVIDCGVDLERFPLMPARPPDQEGAGPAFVCVGGLTERKNVVRLAQAFERLGEGTLTFVGEGPLRAQLEDRRGITLAGSIRHNRIAHVLETADVLCQPSLVEPLGQALLEAMACGRPVVATRIGGPPEFVVPEAGVLVDPRDEDALVVAMGRAAALPVPNLAARAAAELHDVRLQAGRIETVLERAAETVRSRSSKAAP